MMRLLISTLFFVITCVISVLGNGTFTGHCRLPKVKDNAAQGWQEMYEYYVFVFAEGEDVGNGCRTGACAGTLTQDGWFSFSLPAGKYSYIATEPRFFARTTVKHDIIIQDGVTLNQDVILNNDYSCIIKKWSDNVGNNTFYQTFIASSSMINRISISIAGSQNDTNPFPITISLHQGGVNGQQIGPSRSINAKLWGDAPVAFIPGELPVTPGQMYAVKFQSPLSFQPYHATEDVYPNGQAYVGTTLLNSDLNMFIGGDSDDTTVSYMSNNFGIGRLETAWNTTWGQTFKARGLAIAGVDYFPTIGPSGFITSYVQIRENGPTGRIVAPKKTIINPTDYIHGASWGPNESTLIAGNIYFVEIGHVTTTDPNPGFNMWLREGSDGYNDGTAYLGTEQKSDWDLNLTILEYTTSVSQNIGTIQGMVRETGTSDPIPGANLEIKQSGVTMYTLTSATNGTYTLPIGIGTYDITAYKTGYDPDTKTGNVITKNQATTVNFNLTKQATPVDTTPPGIPNLVSPTNGSSTNNTTINFDWSDVTDTSMPVLYELQVSNEVGFGTINQSITTSNSTYAISNMSVGTYYWRVRARDSASPPNNSNWATAWNFIITSGGGPVSDTTAPSSVIDLSAQPGSADGMVNLQWTAPGDDNSTGTLNGVYKIQYLTTNGPWNRNSAQIGVPAVNVVPGTITTYQLTNLAPGLFYFCLWTADDSNNWSGESNKPTAIAQQTVRKLGTPEQKFITVSIPAKFGTDAQEVKIYDTKGKLVTELKQTEFTGGQIVWDGKDKSGISLESGVYIYRSKIGTNKMLYGTITFAK